VEGSSVESIRDIVARSSDAATVRRVFGDPIEKDGVTVIPAARVRGGWGGGSGRGGREGESGETPGSGMGAGGGVSATPAGVFVIRDGAVSWLPAMDLNRTILVGCVTSVLLALVLRGLVKGTRGG